LLLLLMVIKLLSLWRCSLVVFDIKNYCWFDSTSPAAVFAPAGPARFEFWGPGTAGARLAGTHRRQNNGLQASKQAGRVSRPPQNNLYMYAQHVSRPPSAAWLLMH
jgi:hypothetical protein